ncbi:MAG TPA: M50 family metallopeptidase, partial [Dehalococcoidia bacterium]|nr:M50 family metallopeptidase [Dehalococcoidia bacterium]
MSLINLAQSAVGVLGYSVLPFVVILVILVVVHELGHFVTAKMAGVQVLEFGLGYPPKLAGFRFGRRPAPSTAGADTDERTEYTINALPLGGFVRLLGEEDPGDPRSLAAKPRGIRILVLAAGALMNLLLPVVLFTASFMIPQQVPVGRVVIQQVAANSPAQQAGIQSGDQIVSINGEKVQNLGDVANAIRLEQGRTMTWQIRRGRDLISKQVYARWAPPVQVDAQTGRKSQQGPTGIELSTPDAFTQTQSYPIWEAVPKAVRTVFDVLVLTRNQMLSALLARTAPQLVGPVGIAQVTGEVAKQAGGLGLLQIAAQISISLAIVNILPLPMLDGGRIMFVILEIIRRGKRVAPEKEALVHLVGFVLLIGLVVVISYFDVTRIIHGGS